jgi:transcription elongation factor Elf1
MGNNRNRKRKAVRTLPSKMDKKSKHGRQYDENPGPSRMKIGNQTAKIDVSSDQMDTVRKGIIFMDLSLLFGVFN